MPVPIFLNNVSSTVQAGSSAIGSATATGINVASGDGAKFGTVGTGQVIPAVIVDTSTNPETVKEFVWVTAIATDALTVTRQGEESTRYPASTTTIQAGYTIAAVASKTALNQLLAASDLPSGMVGTGVFDRALNLYMPTGVMPTTTRAKMAAVAAGVGGAKLAWIGASMTAGYDGATTQRGIQDIPYRMNLMLGSLGYAAGEPAMVFDDNIAFDTRFALTGTWTHVTQPAAAMYSTSTSAGTITLTCTRSADSFRLTFPSTSTAFTLKIDGAFPASATVVGCTYTAGSGTVTPGGTNTINSVVVTGLAKVPHVALLTVVTGMIPYSAEFYLSNALRLANWGQSSSQTVHWDDTSAFNTELNQVLNWAPDVVVLMLDEAANDYNNVVALATTYTHLANIVTTLQTAGIEVILFTPPPFLGLTGTLGGLNNPPPASFWQNFYTLADSFGCLLIDNNARWVSRAIAFGLSEYGADNFHTSSLGFQDLTASLLAVMAQQVVDPWLPQPVNVPASGSAYTLPALSIKGGTVNITLSANCTITVPQLAAGQRVTVTVHQPSSGGPFTLAWSGVNWGTAGAPSSAPAAGTATDYDFFSPDGASTAHGYALGPGF